MTTFTPAPSPYFFQPDIPLANNLTQIIDTTRDNKDFIPANIRGATGLLSSSVPTAKAQLVSLVLLGEAVNIFAGSNALDCSTDTDNQWQIDMDGSGFVDLVNGTNPDGQMADSDWLCQIEGGVFSFAYLFDVTDQVPNIDGFIGLRLANGKSDEDSLATTITTAFLNVLWVV